MSTKNIPQHIAIIPDGNRRWAKHHGLPSFEGHRKGANLAETIARHARSRGVKILTFWGLSTENFNREEKEVAFLMRILDQFLGNDIEKRIGEKTRFIHIGKKDRFSKSLLKKITTMEEKTKHHTDYTFNLAFDYGGRDEILQAVSTLQKTDEPVTEELFTNSLYTKNQKDPDVIIRTGGEKRLSGLFPWQSVYSELYFTDLLWPDFTEEEFDKALEDYATRQRRFGK